ncbi:MAG: hypothetical protein JWO63_3186 [Frankiales bacterium]|nr:hypothetical protein [Frankiales bacterium]
MPEYLRLCTAPVPTDNRRKVVRRALLVLSATFLAVLIGLVNTADSFAATTSSGSSAAPSASPSTGSGSAKTPARATFGIGPTTLGKTNARGYFSYDMGVGGTYSDHVAVYNYGASTLHLSVFAADLENGDNGDIAVGLQGAAFNDAGGWVKLNAKVIAVTVPGQTKNGPGRVILPFSIQVPNDAAPGDHGAAIVATLSTLGLNPKGENVRLDQRIATRMYLRVAGPLHPSMVVENLKVAYSGALNPIGRGSATVTYTVRNNGNVRLAASQAVSITGLFGTKSKTVTPPNVQLLFPRSSQTVTVHLTGIIPAVLEKAHVTITPLLFQDQAPMAVSKANASVGFQAIPWTLLGLLLLVLLLGAVGWFIRRRQSPPGDAGRHGAGHRPDGPKTPAGPDGSDGSAGSAPSRFGSHSQKVRS